MQFYNTYSYVVGLTLILSGSLPDSNLLATVTLWPKRQYLGIFLPTTPASTEPVWMPMRICNIYMLNSVLLKDCSFIFTLIGWPWCVWCLEHVSIILSAIHAICSACVVLCLWSPQATQYASPIVSTCNRRTIF